MALYFITDLQSTSEGTLFQVHGLITYDLASFSTVFLSYQHDRWMITKGYVQWSPVNGRDDFASSGA